MHRQYIGIGYMTEVLQAVIVYLFSCDYFNSYAM